MRQFSARASAPRRSREKQPCYHLRCSRSVASAAIRINPTTPRVMAASRSANAVPPSNVRFGSKAEMCCAIAYSCFGPKADAANPRARTAAETMPPAGICLANLACAARQVWPRFRRNGASYRCGSRGWSHYKRIPHAARMQR